MCVRACVYVCMHMCVYFHHMMITEFLGTTKLSVVDPLFSWIP